ncbi:protein of unknown function [Candidatus Nitrosotalea okcheonensis]|uniref:Uncharacterized protein n=1 Tax=Candidatus Nitrosotalea okcheonensis TaxID=1903276 RepID=A0A2H1FE76_9ARCH|nr:protein of unknown function [Candidatus Nitrosotalea okcheonensis]
MIINKHSHDATWSLFPVLILVFFIKLFSVDHNEQKIHYSLRASNTNVAIGERNKLLRRGKKQEKQYHR